MAKLGMAQDRTQSAPATLGDVLYAKPKAVERSRSWAALVPIDRRGDQTSALHALYERAHRPVFTLIMRLTANRETAEELTIDVFHDVWRRASRYDAASGTVLGWIMNQARSRAIDRLRFDSRKKRSYDGDVQLMAEAAADPSDVIELREQSERAACGIVDAHAGRAPGNRDDVLRRAYACRSRGAAGSTARHHQDAHSLRTAQAAARADRESGNAMIKLHRNPCEQSDVTCAYAAQALATSEGRRGRSANRRRAAIAERELRTAFAGWSIGSSPGPPMCCVRRHRYRGVLACPRIAEETGKQAVLPPARQWSEPEWEQVAPGIECKLLTARWRRGFSLPLMIHSANQYRRNGEPR